MTVQYLLLKENKSLYPYQFEFRPNHSTNNTLIEIAEQIQKACDNCLFILIVNYNILLTKLEHNGINGNANYWFCSFLTDSIKCTIAKGKNVNTEEITHVIP